MGYYDFYKTLFEDVGVMMTAGLAKFFNTKQKRKIAKRTYKRRLEVKIARSKSQKKTRNIQGTHRQKLRSCGCST
jgi:uncharacterized hydantoinase/oxoprolinase family protein